MDELCVMVVKYSKVTNGENIQHNNHHCITVANRGCMQSTNHRTTFGPIHASQATKRHAQHGPKGGPAGAAPTGHAPREPQNEARIPNAIGGCTK
jgi:hypothetical protein